MPALAPKIKFKPLVRNPAKKDKPFFTPKVKRKVDKKPAKKIVVQEKRTSVQQKPSEKKYATTPKNKKLVDLKKKIDAAASKNKQHEPTAKKVEETKKAVYISPSLDKSSQAQANQVDEMGKQKPKRFDAEKFAADILNNIKRVIPTSKEELESDGASSGKMANAQQAISNTLEEEKSNSGGELGGAASASPDISSIPTKAVTPLKPETAATSPSIKGAAIAPDLKKPSETSLSKESAGIDNKMKASGVSEAQLAKSNEPAFQSAVTEKKKSQEKASGTHQEYLAKAKPVANQAEKQTELKTASSIAQSSQKKRTGFSQVERKKAEQKAKEELIRTKIAQDLERIYNATKTKVETRLANLNTKVNELFDQALRDANTTFENNVRRRTETSFLDDLISWATGIPREIENVFKEEQDLFINSLRPVVLRIGAFVELELNTAMKDIELGKLEVAKYWSSLDKDAQKIGADLYESVNGQFSELETSVEDASEGLKESITTKFNEAIASLEETFNTIKEENKSWLERAFDAVAGVITAILEMKNLLLGILRKAANAIEAIITDPIGFLSNLLRAIKLGFTRFGNNIVTHLKEGFMAWLMGNMPPSIQFPQTWDMKGIFMFVMSVLGLTWQNIRSRAERMFGATVVTALETGFEIFMIVKNEGMAGLWRYIQEQIGNLKTMVIDAIQNMLIEKVVKAGITWVISLFNPAGAFIKACKLIYDVVSWFINNARRLLDLVNSIVDSVTLIVAGQIDSAATFVENSLKRAVPIVIGFLAGLLGIGDLSAKIQAILDKIQAPINKAIDWVLKKAGDFVKKIFQVGKKVLSKILQWLGFEKPFKLGEKTHTILFRQKGEQAELIVQSTPTRYRDFISNIEFKANGQKEIALGKGNAVDIELGKFNSLKTDNEKKTWSNRLIVQVNDIAKYIEANAMEVDDVSKVPSIINYQGINNRGLGTGVKATQLTVSNIEGQETSDSDATRDLTSDLDILKLNKKSRWKRGHLLNAKLGGLVNNTNLTPLSHQANSSHLSKIERAAKKLVTGRASRSDSMGSVSIIYYEVKAIYGKHPSRSINYGLDNDKAAVKRFIASKEEQQGIVPTKLLFEMRSLELKNKKVVDKTPKEVVSGQVDNNLPSEIELAPNIKSLNDIK